MFSTDESCISNTGNAAIDMHIQARSPSVVVPLGSYMSVKIQSVVLLTSAARKHVENFDFHFTRCTWI